MMNRDLSSVARQTKYLETDSTRISSRHSSMSIEATKIAATRRFRQCIVVILASRLDAARAL